MAVWEIGNVATSNIGLFSGDQTVDDLAKEIQKASEASHSRKLLKVKTRISSTPRKLIIYKSDNAINSACSGDSGGPMFFEKDGRLVQIGVTHAVNFESFESITACKGSGVYMNVTYYLDFIHQTINTN